MSVQKRQALTTLTEANSPFVPTKTQHIFQNSANLQLRGNTFDATHMDKFLGSGYGEKGLGTNISAQYSNALKKENGADQTQQMQVTNMSRVDNKATGDSLFEPNSMDDQQVANETTMMQHRTAHSAAPSFVKNSQAIKPSVSFMNLSREQSKMKHFVDLQDGPSSLQKRLGVPTMQEKTKEPILYERERNHHLEKMKNNSMTLRNIKETMYATEDGKVSCTGLKTPKEARLEMQKVKQQLDELKNFNEQQRFLGKRERIIKTGWRHGIVGVDDADSGSTQVFY